MVSCGGGLDEGVLVVGELGGEVLEEEIFGGEFLVEAVDLCLGVVEGGFGGVEFVGEGGELVGVGLGLCVEVVGCFGEDGVVLGDAGLELGDEFVFVLELDFFEDEVHVLSV